jgi:predicted GNAT family acetyltransferase
MTMRTGNRVVRDNPAELRYELLDGGTMVGLVRYRREDGAVALVHTDIDPDLEGTGAGGELVRGALEDLRSRGLGVIPVCPFVRSWLDRHAAYRDLVVDDPASPE